MHYTHRTYSTFDPTRPRKQPRPPVSIANRLRSAGRLVYHHRTPLALAGGVAAYFTLALHVAVAAVSAH